MKFKVREGFVVYVSKVVELDINGAKEKQVQTNSYFPSSPAFELEESDALDHLHKLEPADKDAVKFLDAQVAPVVLPATPTATVDPAVLAAAVAATLQALGVVVPAPVAPQGGN